MDELLGEFLTDTSECLASLDDALLRLERAPHDRDTLSLIFRGVHTIKGTCGFLSLPRLERVAHAGENLLGRLRDGALTATPPVISGVLQVLDRIRLIVGGLAETGTEPAGDDAAVIETLERLLAGEPAFDEPTPDTPLLDAPAPDAADERAAGGVAGPQSIRVAVDVLEGLMTLVSELVLTRNQLLQLARREQDSAFAQPLQRLSQITSDLQEGVMKTRMQPIGHAWNKLPRLVRDLARELGKRIELVTVGQATELDRQVLEMIRDPLTHMVRNSADHGLETPAERRAAGKPETGRITLRACHEGGHVIVEVGDDGRGLPVERIRAKALAQGLASEAELAAMAEARIQRFIFHAGFSTAAAVTSVSGRGVGMDVVKTHIERIGGTIDLVSRPGGGTVFTIKIPLTLAIVSALIVGASGERFAIPQASVVELVRVGSANATLEQIGPTAVLRLRQRVLPLVDLDGVLRLRDGAAARRPDYAVIVEFGPTRFGIMVDDVFETEEIVVKPVAPILRHITLFSGNTILGDGSVIMILDPNGIARLLGSLGPAVRAMADTGIAAPAPGGTAILLFRAGGEAPLGVPLGLVSRIEEVPRERIEFAGGRPVTQYRGTLMPLVPLAGALPQAGPSMRVLVFADGGQCVGLIVDEILDVVEERLALVASASSPGLLGSAVIAGRATGLIDAAHWLAAAQGGRPWGHHDGSSGSSGGGGKGIGEACS